MLSARPWTASRAIAWQRLSLRNGHAAALALVTLLTCLCSLVMWRTFPATQTDIGGDYAYVSWQVSRGARLYHDVLGQQTPLLYLLGAAAYRLWPRPDVFEAVALAVRCLTVVGIYLLSRACRLSAPFCVTACVIYLLLQMGFLFDARFEPNILITLGGVICTLSLTQLSSWRAAIAGFASALFILSKLTFLPLACALAAYLFITRRTLLYPFLLAAGATLLSAVALGWMFVGPDFLQGAFLAHVGSTLSITNFIVSFRYIWSVEGLTVVAAIVGGIMGLAHGNHGRLLFFYLAGTTATIIATVSVGSLAPETLMGEPAVALCATLALWKTLSMWSGNNTIRRLRSRFLLLFAALLMVAQALEARDDWLTIASAAPPPVISCSVAALERYTSPTTPVIAPAYAAFLAKRPLVDGISDFFNWSIRVRRGDATALAQSRTIAQVLHAQHLPLVITSPDLPLPPQDQRALAQAYVPLAHCGSATAFVPRH